MQGLRKALHTSTFSGEFVYWKWHETWRGILVLPALRNRILLEHEAHRLCGYITQRVRAGQEVYLVGFSCGGFVALRAVELLPADVKVRSLALVAAAVDPQHDLTKALDHVAQRLVVSWGLGDFAITGLGTYLFGTAEGTHTPSAGMMGIRHWSSADPKVVQIQWRPDMIRHGNWGGHFTAMASGYVARFLLPAMGVSRLVSQPRSGAEW